MSLSYLDVLGTRFDIFNFPKIWIDFGVQIPQKNFIYSFRLIEGSY